MGFEQPPTVLSPEIKKIYDEINETRDFLKKQKGIK